MTDDGTPSLEDAALAYVFWTHFENPEDFWAVEWVFELSFSQDWETLWRMILELLRRAADDEWALSAIAAGPLEELLSHAGELFIARVETESTVNPVLRRAFRGVFQHAEMPDHVFSRIRTLAEGKLP